MLMKVKKRARVPSLSETDNIDDDNSSGRKPLILKLNNRGKQSSRGKLKNVGFKVPVMKELASGFPSVENGSKTKTHQSDGSALHISCTDWAFQCNSSRVPDGARVGQIRGENGVEILKSMKAVQQDIDAALALMEMANEAPCLPKNGLHSCGGNCDANGMQGIKALLGELNGEGVCGDNCSQVAGKRAKFFQKFQQPATEDQMKEEDGRRLHLPTLKMTGFHERNQKKRNVGNDFSSTQSRYIKEDNLDETDGMLAGHKLTIKLGKKGRQHIETCVRDDYDRVGMLSLGRNWVTKKKKKKADITHMGELVEFDQYHLKSHKVLDDLPISSLKKRGLKKVKAGHGSMDMKTVDSPFFEKEALDNAFAVTKPLKKSGFNLIRPTVHTEFSFSIIHFLSAIRTAMVMPGIEDDALAFDKHLVKRHPTGISWFRGQEKKSINNSEQIEQKNSTCLTISEIVESVRLNPGDPRICEAQEPLQDLVRGALKIFSSREAPLGAKGWKELSFYDKSSKSWSWIGPVAVDSDNAIKEGVSPEAWGLPHGMLVKLVDSFANWLKSVQEMLQKIGSLPAPPMISMQLTIDVKERFRGVRPRKCIATIKPCSEEVRAYFRKEEALRYSVPERAFSYTALDGRKSMVAPLRRCSGKPSLKCRDHFMLKVDRPPQITVLCLVRDAAARLPASMGTRVDVCTLIRDSQYMVEDISDEQVNQVVSGALDRLHYENDPCVQFDGDQKLWVYLHGERDEDDFEDCGTLSIKKRRRQ